MRGIKINFVASNTYAKVMTNNQSAKLNQI